LPHGKNRFHLPDGDSRLTAMLSRFCPERQPIRMLTGVIYNVICGQCAGLPLSWLKTCWLLLACCVRALMSWTAFARYSFGLTAAPHWTAFARYSFGLTAAPHHGNIPLALQPRPITAIFLRPYSRTPSRRYSFGLTAAPIHGDIFFGLAAMPHGDNWFHSRLLVAISVFSLPHGDNQFFFASRQEPISFRLTAIRATRRYQFFLRLTAIINFSLLQGKFFL
jgi:hypothetical protein